MGLRLLSVRRESWSFVWEALKRDRLPVRDVRGKRSGFSRFTLLGAIASEALKRDRLPMSAVTVSDPAFGNEFKKGGAGKRISQSVSSCGAMCRPV